MADWYNVTAVNASNVLTFTQSINNIFMFNQLGNLFLIAIWFISFMTFNFFNNNPKLNMMYASFPVAFFSIILSLVDLVPDFTPYLCWGIFAISIMIVQFSK